ncbi:MAG: ABC transporter ATP-binding protein, partial [Synergistales bacterium]|nr:ABC transporter ATP-binding protein [Synergistales bacterium]
VTHDVEEALRLADEVVLLSSAPMAPVEIVRPSGMGPRPVDDPLWVRTKRRLVASLRREASR